MMDLTRSDYLVIFSSHIDTEDKKVLVLPELKKLKNSGIDVCLCTHSSDYLSDLSEYCKYVIFDSNNEMVNLNDFLENSELIEPTPILGFNFGKAWHGNIYVETKFPSASHSKSALTNLRNGVITSASNNYEWTVWMEYDFVEPILGYRIFIENLINEIKLQNKKCLIFRNIFGPFNIMWGKFFIFKTRNFFELESFFRGKWQDSKKEWIKCWGLNFGESITEESLVQAYGRNNVIEKKINDVFDLYWDTDVSLINTFDLSENKNDEQKELSNIIIYILPEEKEENTFNLHLYLYNKNNYPIVIDSILIYSDDHLLFNGCNIPLGASVWRIDPISKDYLKNQTKIKMIVENQAGSKKYTSISSFSVSEIKNIHNYIMKIKFNNS